MASRLARVSGMMLTKIAGESDMYKLRVNLLTGLSRFSFDEPKGSRLSTTRGRLTDTDTKPGEHEASKGAIYRIRSNTIR